MLKMKIRFRVSWIVCYLLFLFIYGFSMLLSTMRRDGNMADGTLYKTESGETPANEFGLRDFAQRRKKLKRMNQNGDPITSVEDFFE
ncbi:hypothetical protein Avbf_09943 [Armadillidium vulgare]|nr:hypothetical protein Avbf_09943 [Armadillidium vulgare]